MAKSGPLFGDEPWWVRDLARETNTDEQLMRQVLRHAAQQGLIVAIVKDRYYRNDRIVAFANLIRELDQARGSTCAADFRDRLNVGRKLAIQILEYFNRIGFTRRRGNDHCLRDSHYFLKRYVWRESFCFASHTAPSLPAWLPSSQGRMGTLSASHSSNRSSIFIEQDIIFSCSLTLRQSALGCGSNIEITL
jgi:hypothetical protein